MRENGLDPNEVPVVIQFNKRDLPDTKTDAEIEETRQRGMEPIIGAVAIRCDGVLETFFAVLQGAYRNMEGRSQVSKQLDLDEQTFLSQIFSRIDLGGTHLDGKLTLDSPPTTIRSLKETQ